MREIAINIYTYENLASNPTMKQTLLEKHHDINMDNDWFDEFIINNTTETLTTLGFFDIKCYYSGFGSQGNGASIAASISIKDTAKLFEFNCEFDDDTETIEIKQHPSRYSHENTLYWDLETDSESSHFEDTKALCDTLLIYMKDQSRQLYDRLEEDYHYLLSDESIIETLSDLEFTITGEIFNEYKFKEIYPA